PCYYPHLHGRLRELGNTRWIFGLRLLETALTVNAAGKAASSRRTPKRFAHAFAGFGEDVGNSKAQAGALQNSMKTKVQQKNVHFPCHSCPCSAARGRLQQESMKKSEKRDVADFLEGPGKGVPRERLNDPRLREDKLSGAKAKPLAAPAGACFFFAELSVRRNVWFVVFLKKKKACKRGRKMKLHIEVPAFAEKLLRRVAQEQGKTTREWASGAILEVMEDAEDGYIADKALKEGGKSCTWEEIERGLDLEH
ncbi:MAG: hypothetical protein AAF471_06370, partial [Myxococcota bacterium]